MNKLNPFLLSVITLLVILTPLVIHLLRRYTEVAPIHMQENVITSDPESSIAQTHTQKVTEINQDGFIFTSDSYAPIEIQDFISIFYTNLQNKDYELAYVVTRLDETYDQFVASYQNVSHIFFSRILNADSGYELWVSMQQPNQPLSINKINMNIDSVDGNYFITSMRTTEYSQNLQLQCTESSEQVYQDCFIADKLTKKVLYVNQLRAPYFLKMQSTSENLVYLTTQEGSAGHSEQYIFVFDLTTGTISFIDTFEFFAYYPFLISLESQTEENICAYDLPIDEISSYSTACLLPYANEHWYKQNIRTLTEGSRYFSL